MNGSGSNYCGTQEETKFADTSGWPNSLNKEAEAQTGSKQRAVTRKKGLSLVNMDSWNIEG